MGPTLEKLLMRSSNRAGDCVALALGWVAFCDDSFTDREEAALREVIAQSRGEDRAEELLWLAQRGHADDLALACELLKESLDEDNRRVFLRMAIGLAMLDGYLAVSENHTLRFFADLFEVPPREFRKMFRDMTQGSFFLPGDPSSGPWWERVESRRRESTRGEGKERRATRSEANAMSRQKALSILGLEDSDDEAALRKKFRKMAHVHHPDKFQTMGDEAVEQAARVFARIREAYQFLSAG